MDKDIIIIGGGPGGYVAAIRAAQLRLRFVLLKRINWEEPALTEAAFQLKPYTEMQKY